MQNDMKWNNWDKNFHEIQTVEPLKVAYTGNSKLYHGIWHGEFLYIMSWRRLPVKKIKPYSDFLRSLVSSGLLKVHVLWTYFLLQVEWFVLLQFLRGRMPRTGTSTPSGRHVEFPGRTGSYSSTMKRIHSFRKHSSRATVEDSRKHFCMFCDQVTCKEWQEWRVDKQGIVEYCSICNRFTSTKNARTQTFRNCHLHPKLHLLTLLYIHVANKHKTVKMLFISDYNENFIVIPARYSYSMLTCSAKLLLYKLTRKWTDGNRKIILSGIQLTMD